MCLQESQGQDATIGNSDDIRKDVRQVAMTSLSNIYVYVYVEGGAHVCVFYKR